MVDHPRRWDIGFIRNFMLVFSVLISFLLLMGLIVASYIITAEIVKEVFTGLLNFDPIKAIGSEVELLPWFKNEHEKTTN